MILRENYTTTVEGVSLDTCLSFHSTSTRDLSQQSVKMAKYTIIYNGVECGEVLLKKHSPDEFVYLAMIKIYEDHQDKGIATETLCHLTKQHSVPIYIKAESDAVEHILSKYLYTTSLLENWYRIDSVK